MKPYVSHKAYDPKRRMWLYTVVSPDGYSFGDDMHTQSCWGEAERDEALKEPVYPCEDDCGCKEDDEE